MAKERKTILIADDDLSLLSALAARLEDDGFEVLTTQDGYFAVSQCLTKRPDLLLLDVNMPAGSGLTVLQRIRKVFEVADTPVVFVTGSDDPDIVREAFRLGAAGVIKKPFETEELLEAVWNIINNRAEATAQPN